MRRRTKKRLYVKGGRGQHPLLQGSYSLEKPGKLCLFQLVTGNTWKYLEIPGKRFFFVKNTWKYLEFIFPFPFFLVSYLVSYNLSGKLISLAYSVTSVTFIDLPYLEIENTCINISRFTFRAIENVN